jgi:regulator of sigma D
MKKLIAIFLLCGVTFLVGCDDKDAQQYSKELISVLNSYQSEVNKKIKAEKESYGKLAEIYQRAREFDRLEALTQERSERSDKMAEELINGDYEPRPTQFLGRLRDYATFDFELNRKMFELESDAQARYLSDIAALEIDGKNISALSKALGELAKPKGSGQQIKDAAAFAKEVKDELDKLP